MTMRFDRRDVMAGGIAAAAFPRPGFTTVAQGLAFPEGIAELPDGGLAFVEIAAGTLCRLDPGSGRVDRLAQTGGGPNGTAVAPDGTVFIANNGGLTFGRDRAGHMTPTGVPDSYRGGSIQRFDPRSGRLDTLYEAVDGERLKAPNDIKRDRHGDIWFTDTGKSRARSRDHGGLYCARADGSQIRAVAYPLQTPNGLAFSPDQRTLYVALSDRREIAAFDVTARGEVAPGPPRIVAALGGVRLFDNIAVTVDHAILVACVLSGEIVVLSPQGRILRTIRLDDPAPTALAFAGPGRRTLYATLSGSGRIVRKAWPVAGTALPPFADPTRT
jgi:gluconolactonase